MMDKAKKIIIGTVLCNVIPAAIFLLCLFTGLIPYEIWAYDGPFEFLLVFCLLALIISFIVVIFQAKRIKESRPRYFVPLSIILISASFVSVSYWLLMSIAARFAY